VDEYFTPFKDIHFNGEAVFIYHEPKAHTDGDSVILFRGSDVVSAGDIFTPGSYPFIDLERGGSVQGEIAALNHILELTVPAHNQEGGTYVIPGDGRLPLAHDHAFEGRRRERPDQRGSAQDCRRVGSRERGSGRHAVQGLRSARPHARARTPPHQLAG
jgi:glyoxylase-like metal-dependent hydrolase (beta-lactamase superfamily II)